MSENCPSRACYEAPRCGARAPARRPNPRAFLDGAGPAAIGAIIGSAIPLATALTEPWQYAVLAAGAIMLLVLRRGVVLTCSRPPPLVPSSPSLADQSPPDPKPEHLSVEAGSVRVPSNRTRAARAGERAELARLSRSGSLGAADAYG